MAKLGETLGTWGFAALSVLFVVAVLASTLLLFTLMRDDAR